MPFVDTSFFLALLLADDELHGRAIEWQLVSEGPYVTTDYVVLEAVNGLSNHRIRDLAVELVRGISVADDFQVVPASKELMRAGMDLFERRPDKDWSLTDCISFVVMREHGIVDALTADHHFEQAGFRALLRS